MASKCISLVSCLPSPGAPTVASPGYYIQINSYIYTNIHIQEYKQNTDFKTNWQCAVSMNSRYSRWIANKDMIISCLSYSNLKHSQACGLYSQMLSWLSPILFCHYRFIASTTRCTKWLLYQASQLWNLSKVILVYLKTTPFVESTPRFEYSGILVYNSNVLPQAPCDKNIFHW